MAVFNFNFGLDGVHIEDDTLPIVVLVDYYYGCVE